ncbi:DUF2846 domain-containing protein [Lentilitoribacter sp. EG35]|uniref:DUF2846 domain-containing protein n=1 Tax=Lentilitoribacter sp. EG35 TaxID=3234192 RepID=UPI00345F512C
MKFILPIIIFILSGCSPTWQSSDVVSTQNSAAKRQIISASSTNTKSLNGDEVFLLVYREGGFVGSATAWPIQYNGTKVGSLKNGSFIAIKTNAGTKNFTPESHLGIYSEGVEDFSINTQAGRTYYLMHGPDSIYTSKVKIREVNAGQASAKVAKYKLVTVINDYSKTSSKFSSKVLSISGRAFVERGIKTYPATQGFPLLVGDKINVEEGSQATLELAGSGVIKITEKTSFQIPETTKSTAPPGMATKAWEKIKEMIRGESFELKKPTGGGGVRG